jgi:2-(1,2-epoxy-1,2-dihydrophenyl)acetyl-CoA isomerase
MSAPETAPETAAVPGLVVTPDGPILRVTLDRPERKNALTRQMVTELARIVRDAAADDHTRVLVLRGSGSDFCAGIDLTESREERSARRQRAGHVERRLASTVHRLIDSLLTAEIPVVTAIDGWAAGLGCVLALAGDYVVAADGARFWAPFVGRGFVPDSGTTWLLPRLVGMARARDMILRGRAIDAAEALSWGMVNQVVSADALETEVQSISVEFATAATVSVGLAKGLLARNASASLEAALYNEAMAQELAFRSADFKEGTAAFAERRAPTYSGW